MLLQLENDLTEVQKEEQQGTALQHFVDSDLFFVDKVQFSGAHCSDSVGPMLATTRHKATYLTLAALLSTQAGDEQTATAVAKGLSKKRKQPSKPLRCEVIAGTNTAKLASRGKHGPKQRGQLILPHKKQQKQLQQKHQGKGVYKLPAKDTFDLWAEQPSVHDPRLDAHNNIPGTIEELASRPAKRQKKAVKSSIKAVPIDPAGCSYNPDADSHEEAVAEAVASEMQKVYRRELQSSGNIPQFVSYQPETDELALLQVDAESDDDNDDAAHTAAPALTSNEDSVSAEGDKKAVREKRHKKDKGLATRNRLLREDANKKQQLKAQRRDIDNVSHLQRDLEVAAMAKSVSLLVQYQTCMLCCDVM